VIIAKNIKLKNILFFDHATVPLGTNGLVVVAGNNLQSNVDNASNGAGKSLLLGVLPHLLFGASPLASGRKRRTLLDTNSSIEFDWFDTATNDNHLVIQTATGYQAFTNGFALEHRTLALATSWLAGVFPVTQQEFYTRVYLTTQRPCVLLHGNASERQEFLLNVFGVDWHDRIRAVLNGHLKTATAATANRANLERQHAALVAQLATFDANLDTRIATLTAKLSDAEHRTRLLDVSYAQLSSRSCALRRLLAADKRLDVLRSQYQWETPPHKLIPQLQQLRTWLVGRDQHLAVVASQKATKQRLVAALAELSPPTTTPLQSEHSLEQLLATTSRELAAIENSASQWQSLTLALSERWQAISKWKDVAELDAGAVAEQLAWTQQVIKLSSTHVGGACPLCGSNVSHAQVASHVQQATEAHPKLVAAQRYGATKQQLSELDYSATHHARLDQRAAKIRTKLAHTRQAQQLQHRRDVVEKQLRELKISEWNEPRPVVVAELDSGSLEEVLAALDLCSTIVTKLATKTTLASELGIPNSFVVTKEWLERTIATTTTRAERREAQRKTLVEKTRIAKTKLANLNGEIANREFVRQQLASLEQEMQRAAPAGGVSAELLTTLVAAYGPRGIKQAATRRVAAVVSEALNRYSHYVFCEPTTWELAVDKTGVVVLATRNGRTADVRTSSGAESNCFRLLLLLALTSLLPDSHRTNFCVMDEVDANLDLTSRKKFQQEFLPQLQSVIPNVVMITPRTDGYTNCTMLTVTKANNHSSVALESI